MPSKKRKYNARFPAGRIKKIMQTDEEVGKVAQAVPIIISRTLELFVGSLLTKATQITIARNAKTLSPSHVKQCILAESRFDFLRDLVKNIPDVSAAEEKEMISAENSPNSSRSSEPSYPRKLNREDSSASNSTELTTLQPVVPSAVPSVVPSAVPTVGLSVVTSVVPSRDIIRRAHSQEHEPLRIQRTETVTSPTDTVIDLSTKSMAHPSRSANFYQETLIAEPETTSVIRVNPSYTPQPSTSQETPPKTKQRLRIDLPNNNNLPIHTPTTPITPIINIDFSKNLSKPEIKVLDMPATTIVPIDNRKLQRKRSMQEQRKIDLVRPAVDVDSLNSGNLQIDEDYDT